MTWQKIQAEIAAHESTLEELKRNVRSLKPASPESRTPRGGSHLDVLQVNIANAVFPLPIFLVYLKIKDNQSHN